MSSNGRWSLAFTRSIQQQFQAIGISKTRNGKSLYVSCVSVRSMEECQPLIPTTFYESFIHNCEWEFIELNEFFILMHQQTFVEYINQVASMEFVRFQCLRPSWILYYYCQ